MLPVRFHNRMVPSFGTEFSDLFDDFFKKDFPAVGTAVPSINIVETADCFRIDVAAPGLEKEDFNVEVKDNKLTIASEKEIESLKEGETLRRKEFSYAKFRRTFIIPLKLDSSKIEANYKSGILSVHVPRKEEVHTEARKISIG